MFSSEKENVLPLFDPPNVNNKPWEMQHMKIVRFGENEQDVFLVRDEDRERWGLIEGLKRDPTSPEKWLELLKCPPSFPAKQYSLVRLFRRATTLIPKERCRHNKNYVEIWIRFAQIKSTEKETRDTFKYMKTEKIGEHEQMFYEEYARFEAALGNHSEAEEILFLGVRYGALSPQKKNRIIMELSSSDDQKSYPTAMQTPRDSKDRSRPYERSLSTPISSTGLENKPVMTTPSTQTFSSSTSIPSTHSSVTKLPRSNMITTPSISTRVSLKSQSTSRKPSSTTRLFSLGGPPLRVRGQSSNLEEDDDEDDTDIREKDSDVRIEMKDHDMLGPTSVTSSMASLSSSSSSSSAMPTSSVDTRPFPRHYGQLSPISERTITNTMNVSLGPVGTTSGKSDLSYIKNWTPRTTVPSTNSLTASANLTKSRPPTPVISNNNQPSNAISNDIVHSSYASESVRCPTPVQNPRSNSNPNANNPHEPFSSRKSIERASPSSVSTGSSHSDHSPPARDPFQSLLNNRLIVSGDPYIKLEQIGSGGSSKVYRILGPDLKIYALKKIKLKRLDPASIEQYNNEIQLLKRLQGNPHIIRLIAAEKDLQQRLIHVVMEHGEIDLSEKLQKMKGSGGLEENFLRITWMQMLQAVHAIHSERIIHGDLKPANFLFVNGALKLIDFGIAKAISNDTTNIERESQVGTVNYMSPEAIQGNSGRRGGIHGKMKVGRASDIWSLGCILYQIVYGKPPFADLHNIIEKFRCIIDPSYQISFPPLKNKDLENVIRSCLQRDHRLRPTIEGPHGLLNHPFLKSSGTIGNPSSTTVTLNNAAQILDQVGEVLKQTGLSSMNRVNTSISMLQNEIQTVTSEHFNNVSSSNNHLQRGSDRNHSSLGGSNNGVGRRPVL